MLQPSIRKVTPTANSTQRQRQFNAFNRPGEPGGRPPASNINRTSPLATSPVAVFGAYVIALYLSLHAFYASEFLYRLGKTTVPIIFLLAVTLPLLWLAVSPQPVRFFRAGIALPYMLLLAWWMLSAVFMSYKGYILELAKYGVRYHIVPIMFCGMLFNLRLIRIAVIGYASGFLVALLLCWRFGEFEKYGRFAIPDSSLGNPNDLALNIVLGMAFLSVLLINGTIFNRLLVAVAMLASVYYALKTGSRANFITAAVCLAVAWKVASGKTRAAMMASAVAAGLLMTVAIPKDVWTRLVTYTTVSQSDSGDNKLLEGAVGSTQARANLQLRALQMTLHSPIVGVGPRMFMYAVDQYMREEEGRRRGLWQVAHNTYLDISAETGLVGLGLYVACIVWCVRTNFRCIRAVQARTDLRAALAQSCSLLFASVVWAFGTLFCSLPYIPQFAFLVGLTAANWLALQDAGAFRPQIFTQHAMRPKRRADAVRLPASGG